MAAIDSELHANRTPRFVCEGRLVAREQGGFSSQRNGEKNFREIGVQNVSLEDCGKDDCCRFLGL